MPVKDDLLGIRRVDCGNVLYGKRTHRADDVVVSRAVRSALDIAGIAEVICPYW